MIRKLLETTGHRTNQQLNTAVKLLFDQMMRNRNFKAGNDAVKEVQSPRVKKETKALLRGKWDSVFSGKHTDKVLRRLM